MKYDEFREFIEQKCMHETIFIDSEGRDVLIIRLIDAYDMVNKAKDKE